GTGAVIYGEHMTYTGPTRIMNTYAASGTAYGILRFLIDDALPANNQMIWGAAGTDAGAMNLNGTNQTVGSIETTPGQQANGIQDNNASNLHGGHDTLTISGNRTTSFSGAMGFARGTEPNQFALNLPATNTGSLTLTNGASLYTDGTTISGGTIISRNTLNNSANSPMGSGPVTVNGTSSSQFGTFGGSGQVVGAVTHNAFSHLVPGGPSAVDVSNPLTLNGGLTLNAGSNADFDLNGFGADTINTTALNVSTTTDVNL